MNDGLNYKKLYEQQLLTLAELNQTLAEQTKLIQQLQQQLEQLLRARFGKKSERISKAKSSVGKIHTTAKSTESNSSQRAFRELPASLERRVIEHDVPEEQKQCPQCDVPLTLIKAVEKEQLAYRPGSLYVKKHRRHCYACRFCQQTIITAVMPNQPIEKGLADASLLAQVMIDKYQDHLPLYRQECRWLRQGIVLSRQTLCDWVMGCASLFVPLVEEMKQDLLVAKKIHSDDTPVPVLAKGKTHQGRLWTYVGGCGNAPPVAVIYDYTQTRSQQGPLNFLKDYRGYLQADAYAGYDKLYKTGDIIEVGCMAHARRKFFEAYECAPEDKYLARSKIALDFIGQLYNVENQTKAMPSLQRKYYRRHYAKPILKQFYRWLKINNQMALPKSLLGKAISYTLNHWRALCHYCRDGILDIDNNVAERSIKPLVIGRKNYLFAGSHDGAKAAATIYSLIETCKLHGVNTYHYLSDVLNRLPNTLNKNIRLLLPYHWQPPNDN